MTVFDEATAVRRRSDGGYDTILDPRFAVVAPGNKAPAAVNGGILMVTVLRAVLDCAPQPHPVATSASFLRVPRLAPAEVHVSWLKQGRTASIARGVLIQDGEPVLDTTITTGTLPAGPVSGEAGPVTGDADTGASHGSAVAPEIPANTLEWTGGRDPFPDVSECVDLGKWPGTVGADGTEGFAGQVEVLLDPACTGWRRRQPGGVPEMRGYVRLRDHREPDALLLALAVDALPPVVFGLGATGWTPTVTLTWHMRAVPAPGPLQVAARSRHVSGGWFDEEAEVWDTAGRLVAQSRQIARLGRGRLRVTAG